MRIGELLLQSGVITQEQLDGALALQLSEKKKLGELLIQMGAASERQVIEALEFQLGISVIELKDFIPVDACLRLITPDVARKHHLIPVERRGDKLRVAMLDPLDQASIEELNALTGLAIQPLLSTRSDLEQAIWRGYGHEEASGLLDELLQAALNHGEGRISIEPRGDAIRIKYKQKQRWVEHSTVESPMKSALIQAVKRLAGLQQEETNLPWEGSGYRHLQGLRLRCHISVLPTVQGETIWLDIRVKPEQRMDLDKLGFSEAELHLLRQHLVAKGKLMIVASPPGHGRTTALYAMVEELVAKGNHKMITIEDTVEHVLQDAHQVEKPSASTMNTASVLRSAMLHEPDTLMLSDIADIETLELLLRAVQGGVKGIGGMEGASAVGILQRLIGLGVDTHLLAANLSMIVVQRLVRSVCPQCMQTLPATDEEMTQFESHGVLRHEDTRGASKSIVGNFRTFVSSHISGRISVHRGKGCRKCDETGFRGHTAIHEILVLDETVRRLMTSNQPLPEIEQHLKVSGHHTILHNGLLKAKEGLTTVEEVVKKL